MQSSNVNGYCMRPPAAAETTTNILFDRCSPVGSYLDRTSRPQLNKVRQAKAYKYALQLAVVVIVNLSSSKRKAIHQLSVAS